MTDDPYRFWEGPGPAPDEIDYHDDEPSASELADLANEPRHPREWTEEELDAARYDPETDPF